MAWGATIWGPDGRVQFDSTWPQMVLVAKGRITATSQTITVPNGVNPMMAFRPVNCNAAVETQGRSGSTFTYNFVMYAQSSGGYIDYWVYDKVPMAKPTSGWGLAFMDANGNCTFDSQKTPMVLAPQTTQPSGRVYAISPSTGPYFRETVEVVLDSFGNTVRVDRQTEIGGWVFNGTSFAISAFDPGYELGFTTDSTYDPSLSSYVILDVTNH